jgi:hypothetical protein
MVLMEYEFASISIQLANMDMRTSLFLADSRVDFMRAWYYCRKSGQKQRSSFIMMDDNPRRDTLKECYAASCNYKCTSSTVEVSCARQFRSDYENGES